MSKTIGLVMAPKSFRSCLKLARSQPARLYHSSVPSSYTVAKLLGSPSDTEEKQVYGFIRSLRKQKQRTFAAIGDGSSLAPLQALLTPAQAQHLSTGSAVCFKGQWKDSPNKNVQSHELHVTEVSILGTSNPATFPLQKKYQTTEYLRTMPHIRPRIPFNSLMLRFRSQSIARLTQFFASQDFVQTHPPIITSSDCEGAGEVFNVGTEASQEDNLKPTSQSNEDDSFFRSPKYLTVSSQLHLEALAQSVGKVWTLSPTFRAEKSDTSRHLSEFYMLEAELNFTDQLEGVMTLVEDMLRDLTSALYNSNVGREIIHGRTASEDGAHSQSRSQSDELERRWQGMMSASWPRISYTEAISVLQQSTKTFVHKPVWGHGLQAEHEKFIANSIGKGKPVFVTHYPQEIKAFYMLPSAARSSSGPTVDCFDLIVPELCEIAGGSMREHRLSQLLETMQTKGIIGQSSEGAYIDNPNQQNLAGLEWYVDLRRWGSAPHGGFGLGFDRLLGYLAGVPSIREVVAFPRWVGRCDC